MQDCVETKYFDDLLTETSNLLALWYQWEAIFDRPQEQLDRIGHAGNLLFGSIERVFYRDVVLGICRLTDPEHQGNNRNISINRFKSECYSSDTDLQELVKKACEKAGNFRSWRSKRLAHIDARTGVGWRPPQGCERQAVSEALHAICSILRHVSITYHDTDLLLDSLKPQIIGSVERTLCNILTQKIS